MEKRFSVGPSGGVLRTTMDNTRKYYYPFAKLLENLDSPSSTLKYSKFSPGMKKYIDKLWPKMKKQSKKSDPRVIQSNPRERNHLPTPSQIPVTSIPVSIDAIAPGLRALPAAAPTLPSTDIDADDIDADDIDVDINGVGVWEYPPDFGNDGDSFQCKCKDIFFPV